MLAQTEEVQARLLRTDPLRDKPADALWLAEKVAITAYGQVPEAVDTHHDRVPSACTRHRHLPCD
jgi:hypothetical protein